MSNDNRYWYAVYTKPRCEKKVHALLANKGIEAYCPLNRVRKKWSDRIKWVDEPLFKSYVFVRITQVMHADVRRVDGVVNFVYWLGKPAVVKDFEIEAIRRFLNEHDEVQAIPVEIRANSSITIVKGAFMDKKAIVLKAFHNKVQVIIESIGYSLVALIDKRNLKIRKNI